MSEVTTRATTLADLQNDKKEFEKTIADLLIAFEKKHAVSISSINITEANVYESGNKRIVSKPLTVSAVILL